MITKCERACRICGRSCLNQRRLLILIEDLLLLLCQLLRYLDNKRYIVIASLCRILKVRNTFSLQLDLGVCLCSRWNRVINLTFDGVDLYRSAKCSLCECDRL